MRGLLSKRRYEVLAALVFGLFALVHLGTSQPLIRDVNDGGPLHRFVQSFEARISTLLFRFRGARPAHPDVVVLELDERGAQRFGLWPWPRDVMANALDGLLEAGVKVVGLDMSFIDATAGNEREQRWLAALAATPELPPALAPLKAELEARLAVSPDQALEDVLRKAGPRVVQGLIPYDEREAQALAPETRARAVALATPLVLTQVPGSVKGSFKPIALDAVAAHRHLGVQAPNARYVGLGNRFGHFSTVPDLDGTIRRYPTLVKLTEPPGFFPALAIATAAQQLDASLEPAVENDELLGVRLRLPDGSARFVPMQNDAPYTLINYPGPDDVFSRLSVVDVIDGTFDRAKVAGKAVLVGVTIIGSSGDQRVTPFNDFESGVYTHASLLSSILSGEVLDRPWYLRLLELLAMAGLGLGLAVVTARVSSFPVKLAVMAAVLVLYGAATLAAFSAGLLVAWVVPTLSLTVTAFGTIFLGYLSVDREKLKMRSTFSRYLGEDVMDAALEHAERLNRGEKREMTVLFSDIRGFTSLSEHMSPEQLATFINQYLSPMTKIVFDEKGTLDKYIGDAVMAFWNAPLDQPDHALRACRAAVRMLERLDELKAEWRAAGLPELEIGIGVNTGPMVVGNMGSDVRVDYTVLGDAVNLGARLEGTNKEYGTRIIISEFTRAAVKDGLVTRRLGAVRVKGKKVPVGIHELRGVGSPSAADAAAIAAFEAGLDAWLRRDWDTAQARFTEVLQAWPNDLPARDYLSELEVFRKAPPPPEWDGVVSLKSK
jgi:adenylate cyclase